MDTLKRLFDFPEYQLKTFNLDVAFATKYNGRWEHISSAEYVTKANQFSRGLLELGIGKDDKIAVISTNNRTEWNIVDIGVLQIGAQNVPIYPTISSEDYEYILNHSEAKYCFVSDKEVLDKILAISGKLNTVREVYSFNELVNCAHWTEVLELGRGESRQPEVDALKDQVDPGDLATIIYTSGTTGVPKGVMLSHDNLVSNVMGSTKRLPIEDGNVKALSFLPLCHVYERMLIYLYQFRGVSIYYAESLETISENLKEVRPHIMTAVPRLLEKIYDKIIARGYELSGIKKKLFFWAVDVGLKYEPYGKNGWLYEQKLKWARKLIFSKWKEGVGGNLGIIASGSAALQPRLARIFNAAEFGVMEGYGLTETSPVVSVNDMRNGNFRIGTVGKPIEYTEVKIAEDGEILVKGPQIMQGYYKNPELTAQVIVDGYFHTGDIGEIDQDGFLKITDRKKEMFKTSGGKYVAPQVLENRFKESLFIEQIMVVGEGEKMPAAIIQPAFEHVREWAKAHHFELGTNEELVNDLRVLKRIQEEVDLANGQFAKWEKVKKFRLTPEVWSVEAGHLTPTMKLRRRIVKQMYMHLYNDIYGH